MEAMDYKKLFETAVAVVIISTLRVWILGGSVALASLGLGSFSLWRSLTLIIAVCAVFVTVFIAIFAALAVVETSDAILFCAVCRLFYLRSKLLTLQLLDLAACAVCSDDLTHSGYG